MSERERVALVTGAAKRLGKAIALELGRHGHHVVVHFGQSEDEAGATAEEIRALGVRAETAEADLTSAEAITGMMDRVGELFGRLDVLVNSAATFDRAPFAELDRGAWDRALAVNLRAPALCLRSALPWLRRAASAAGVPASVVNMVDLSGIFPWRGYAHHGAAKAGLLQLTRTAALELAPDVRVNAVAPGPILPPPGLSPDSEEWRSVADRVPLGRSGEPRHVTRAVLFLLENDFVTGEVVFVDGGEHLLGSSKR